MTLNEVVTFYRKRQTRADDGRLSQVRDKVCKVYAMVRPMSGSERAASLGRESYGDYRFHVHRRSDIQEADILVWDGVDYNIHFIGDAGNKGPYMYIDAQRGGGM